MSSPASTLIIFPPITMVFSFMAIMFTVMPRLIPFPVLISLPGSPVFMKLSMGDLSVPWWQAAKVVWNMQHNIRYFMILDKNPTSVVGCGSIPVAMMRTVPVAVIKEDVHIEGRGKIDVCSRDDNNGRRYTNDYTGWRRKIYPDVDINSSRTIGRDADKNNNKDSKKQT
ncbi:MAG: hypothetical protein V1897_00080 [Pseudomonadota bacterium]